MTEATTTTKVTFSPQELEVALLGDPVNAIEGVYDYFDRCLLAEELICLKDTALAVKNGEPLSGDGIDVGISRRNMSKENCTILREFAGVEDASKDFQFKVGQVPVRVKVFTRDYQWFKNPEPVLYQNCMTFIANPFDNYFKARHIIH